MSKAPHGHLDGGEVARGTHAEELFKVHAALSDLAGILRLPKALRQRFMRAEQILGAVMGKGGRPGQRTICAVGCDLTIFNTRLLLACILGIHEALANGCIVGWHHLQNAALCCRSRPYHADVEGIRRRRRERKEQGGAQAQGGCRRHVSR